MAKIAKRAQIIYDILRNEISQMDFSKRGEERVEEFLKVIKFENAGEVIKKSLLVLEEQPLRVLKTIDVFHALQKKDFDYDWQEYYLQLQSDFRRWYYCDEIRKVAGKPTGANDLFRLYIYLGSCRNELNNGC